MGELITAMFSSFTEVINGLAGGLSSAFQQLIYVGGNVDGGFNPLITFIFTMAGVGLASGILYKIFGLVQSKRRGG